MFKERFIHLVKAVNEDEDLLSAVEDQMNNFVHYVDAVYTMEVQIQTLRFRLEGAEYREAVTTLDNRRRTAHEAAISGCAILNRVSKMVGTETMYDGDLDDRYAVADFCMKIVDELFHGCTKCSMNAPLD